MTETKKEQYFYGTGRRKSAIARVRLTPGKGKLILNGKDSEISKVVGLPLIIAGQTDKYDLNVTVAGGGMVSQLEAIRLGVARALLLVDSSFRQGLRKAGLLTRDARVKERKKPGLRRARRAPQWAKR